MDNSPFVKLPPKLRNQIWQYTLIVDTPIFLMPAPVNDRRKVMIDRRPEHNVKPGVNLLRTCKAIYQEAHQLLYASNTFALHSRYRSELVQLGKDFTFNLSNTAYSALRNIEVRSGSLYTTHHNPHHVARAYYPAIKAVIKEARRHARATTTLVVTDQEFEWRFRFSGSERHHERAIERVAAELQNERWRPMFAYLQQMVAGVLDDIMADYQKRFQ